MARTSLYLYKTLRFLTPPVDRKHILEESHGGFFVEHFATHREQGYEHVIVGNYHCRGEVVGLQDLH